MPNFRYVAVAPDRVEEHRAIGKAHALHDFLIDHQTDPSGRVWYGKVISYAWIRSKWLTAPTARTLKRHMARLKAAGLVRVQPLTRQFGMRITVLRSAKWQQAQAQMGLFPAAEILSITRGIASGKLSKKSGNRQVPGDRSVPTLGTEVSPQEVKKYPEEKTNAKLADARSAPGLDEAAFAARRRLLAEQARMLMGKAKGS